MLRSARPVVNNKFSLLAPLLILAGCCCVSTSSFGWPSCLPTVSQRMTTSQSGGRQHDVFDVVTKFIVTLGVGIVVTCASPLVPLASFPAGCFAFDDLPCPEYFATQSLGIQNVAALRSTIDANEDSSSYTTRRGSSSRRPASGRNNVHGVCKQEAKSDLSEEASTTETVQGTIYLPSNNNDNDVYDDRSWRDDKVYRNDNNLIIVGSSSSSSSYDNNNNKQQTIPDAYLAVAKIPLSQIEAFPISFRLGSQNVLSSPSRSGSSGSSSSSATLYVTAKICPNNNNNNNDIICKDDDAKFFGRGTSRMLLLPGGGGEGSSFLDDEEETILVPRRAAASIRLVKPTKSDAFYTW
jgi:hypothetical protein